MVYEMLTGHPPFEGTLLELMFAHLQRDLPSVTGKRDTLPPVLDDVLLRATAKQQDSRFLTAADMWNTLSAALDGSATEMLQAPVATTNPYFHRGPIRDASYFFGREREKHQILGLLQNGQNISLLGQRRFGKTSLLYHIKQNAPASQGFIVIFIDCGSLVTLSHAQIYRTILEEVTFELEQIGASPAFRSLEGNTPLTYRNFERELRVLFRDNWRLVIMLDEFEMLSRNENLESEFFTGLRALAMRHPVTYMTASRQPIVELTYADASTLSSPFFNIFATIRLGLFSEPEARNLITTLHTFDENTVTRLFTLSGGNPLFTQIAGYHAFEAAADGSDIATVVQRRFRDDVLPHLEYYWRSLSTAEQTTLAALPAATDQELLGKLEHACLIKRDAQDTYHYFSPILEWFIRQRHVPGLVQSQTIVIDENRRHIIFYGTPLEVPPLQYELFHVLVSNAHDVMTVEALETALWGDEYVDDPERLKSVVKGARRTLGDRAEHIENVRGVGYRWRARI